MVDHAGVVIDENDLGGKPGGRADLVRDEENAGLVIGGQLVDQVKQAVLRCGIELAGGFVEHQELGLAHQRPRHQRALALPAGQLAKR